MDGILLIFSRLLQVDRASFLKTQNPSSAKIWRIVNKFLEKAFKQTSLQYFEQDTTFLQI